MESGNYIIQLLEKECLNGKESITLEKEYKGKVFQIKIADKDRFTYLFDSIRIANSENQPKMQSEELEHRASKLCEKVTYLVEDLDVIEVDSTTGAVLLRSKLVNKDTESISNYFEVTINTDRVVSILRLSYNRRTKKTAAIDFNLTAELTVKILNHLIETIA